MIATDQTSIIFKFNKTVLSGLLQVATNNSQTLFNLCYSNAFPFPKRIFLELFITGHACNAKYIVIFL